MGRLHTEMLRALSSSGEIMGEYFEIFHYLDFNNSLDFIK